MYRRIFLVVCMVLFSVLHVASFDYDSYDYDCSFMRTATACAAGQIEMLVQEKYTLPSFIYSREEGLLSRKRKMIKFVSFAMCFVSLL